MKCGFCWQKCRDFISRSHINDFPADVALDQLKQFDLTYAVAKVVIL